MSLFPVFAPVASAPVSISLTDNDVQTPDQTTYTFSSKSLGTAGASRKIIVCNAANGQASPYSYGASSATVAGNSCTKILDAIPTANDDYGVTFWYVDLATGTTGDIVITYDKQHSKCGLAVWAVYNAPSGAPAVTDVDEDNGATQNGSLTLGAGGGAIAYGYRDGNTTASWTGLTEDFDQVVETPQGTHSGASGVFADAQSPLAVQLTWVLATSMMPAGFIGFNKA